MKTTLTNPRFNVGSLRGSRDAHTVLVRMAEDEARAGRIRELKKSRPDLTWRRIGDYVGVSERAAVEWQKTGGIEYENAKLDALFGVEPDFVWSGPREHAPDLMEIAARAEQVDGVADEFRGLVKQIFERDDLHRARMYERLERIELALADRAEHDQHVQDLLSQQNELLAQQAGLLGMIRKLLGLEPEATPQARAVQAARTAAARSAPRSESPPSAPAESILSSRRHGFHAESSGMTASPSLMPPSACASATASCG